METPIAFIIFNRPKETKVVFDAIAKIKPKKLFIIADGPSNDATRAIVEKIDWDCDVQRNYSEVNLGCRNRVSSGLDWVFSMVDRAIILEDDCVPDPSFFDFCTELLEKYKDDTRVMHIGGNYFGKKKNQSYYFSKIPHIWGWATWKRAWKLYDVDIQKWPGLKKSSALKPLFKNPAAYEYWSTIWDQYERHGIDSWDGQWFFACLSHHGLAINPYVNLVQNIGFSASATHTKVANEFANVPAQPMHFPLTHPAVVADDAADNVVFRNNFGIDKKLKYRLLRPIKNHFPKLYQKVKNTLIRIKSFKNWYIFVWPLNHIGKRSKIAILKDGTKVIIRDIYSSDFSIAMELASPQYYGIDISANPKTIVDVGANIGIFAISMAKKFPQATVYAIEAETENYDQMLKNIELNQVQNIKPMHALVADKPGTRTLYLSKFNSAHSTDPSAGSTTQQVEAISLDSFSHIDLLKVDVEGAEYEIFKDSIPDCERIIIETHYRQGENEKDFIKKFRSKYSVINQSPIYKLKKL